MARGDQLARQWKIIQTLIPSKLGKSAAELAEEIECHQRGEVRIFALDRIKMLHQTKDAFEVPEESERVVPPA